MSQIELEILIGGRSFAVACQQGEEAFLQSAAALLDAEASVLMNQMGRVPEQRMLLMAGLMLADKTAGLEDRLRQTEAEMVKLKADRDAAVEEADDLPPAMANELEVLVRQAESAADAIEEKSAAAAG